MSYTFPQRSSMFIFPVALHLAGARVASPTISAGDFQVSKDFGAFANLATLPAVAPAASGQVQVSLSTEEMNADNVLVKWHDPENTWDDGEAIIQPLQLQLKFSEYIPV